MENVEAEEISQSDGCPKLAGAFETVLELAAERFDRSAANRCTLVGVPFIVQVIAVSFEVLDANSERFGDGV